jgi:hypothetical protein
MCTLTEPVPSLYFDWFHPHPNEPLITGVFLAVLFGVLLVLVWSSPDGQDTRLSRKQAALFVLGGCGCLLLASYWLGVLAPYGSALDAWYGRELDVLSQACWSRVLTSAYNTAHGVWEAWNVSVMVVLLIVGGQCAHVAWSSRNYHGLNRRGVAPHRNP